MNKFSNTIAFLLLTGMFFLMLGSSWNDSAIFDEIAHIPAGYTYLSMQDGRINPEHPPLIKDLAAFPLLFLGLNFDSTGLFWTAEDVNSRQWDAGNLLLYGFENDPDQILFWSRLPMILLAIIFGFLLFKWVRGKYGNKVGLLTLFFFALSPTFLAHSRFVTTDLGAAFGFFLGIIFFLKFLDERNNTEMSGEDLFSKKPRLIKSIIIFGVVFGLLQLLKFSLVLLVPIFLILGTLFIFLEKTAKGADYKFFIEWAKLLGQLVLVGLIGLLVIWGVYSFHVWNYPIDQHIEDVEFILGGYKVPVLANLDFWLIRHEITRPLGHYFYGFLMVAQRTAGGNTAYFLGEVSSDGWFSYFPVLAFAKEQLPFYVLALIAAYWAAMRVKRGKHSLDALVEWLRNNFVVATSIIFILFYWVSSILNPLNIGVRHILPTFPFLYFLVSREIVLWLHEADIEEPKTWGEWVKSIYETYLRPAPKYIIVSVLLLWMVAEMLLAFPSYLSYYNLLAGGTEKGYFIATDSNYDWGQDLRRLKDWAEKNNIQKINLDYFGGGSPSYYLEDRFEPWWSARGRPEPNSYLAVSVNTLSGAWGKPIGDIVIKPEDSYSWLREFQPIDRAGTSIFIYKMP